MNAINLTAPISPQSAEAPSSAMEKVVDAIRDQARKTGQALLVQLNHPNYMWNTSAADLFPLKHLNFLEIHSALASTRCYGDETHPPVEQIWDEVLTHRLKQGGEILYGTFSDDAHFYNQWEKPNPYGHPGCAWMMVRASALSPEAIVKAIQLGECYGSSGVMLKELRAEPDRFFLEINHEPGVEYVTQFIGTRRGDVDFGQVLAEAWGASAEYRFRGDELYVRARVRSSKPHPRPHAAGDVETAWTQPCRPRGATAPCEPACQSAGR